jgi:hypothetical protein
MKTNKLIELLQKEDPTGEGEVLVGNTDIFCLEGKPGYWDGCKEVLVRDWTSEYYNVVGAEYSSEGSKISIRTLSIEDAVYNNPDLPVKVTDTFVNKRMQQQIDKIRKEAKDLKENLIGEFFIRAMNKIKEGWRIFEDPDMKEHPQMYFAKGDAKEGFVFGFQQAVKKTGFFKSVLNEDQIIEWVFKLHD